MALIYVGIDEAGYGPLLGPLCVGAVGFRVEGWREGEAAPDLWEVLGEAVCRSGSDRARRIAVEDSKKLKLANSSTTKHPLHHLERGVLAFAASIGCAEGWGGGGGGVGTDTEYFRRMGAEMPSEAWYAGVPIEWPVGESREQIAIAANTLRRALARAGVSVQMMACEAIFEGQFNELVELTGTKASTTEAGLTRHLRMVWERFARGGGGEAGEGGDGGGGGVRVVCDRQGGRTQYGPTLSRMFPEAVVRTLTETERQSRYEVVCEGAVPKRMVVSFMTEAETAHLPVALASMVAKLTRESFMARLNRYWCERLPELKPTAGYRQDGWRWLEDLERVLTDSERTAMIRRA